MMFTFCERTKMQCNRTANAPRQAMGRLNRIETDRQRERKVRYTKFCFSVRLDASMAREQRGGQSSAGAQNGTHGAIKLGMREKKKQQVTSCPLTKQTMKITITFSIGSRVCIGRRACMWLNWAGKFAVPLSSVHCCAWTRFSLFLAIVGQLLRRPHPKTHRTCT